MKERDGAGFSCRGMEPVLSCTEERRGMEPVLSCTEERRGMERGLSCTEESSTNLFKAAEQLDGINGTVHGQG